MSREIRLQIDDELCRACSRCLAAKACKVRAIVRLDPGDSPFLDTSRCYECRLCILACPFDAVRVAGGSRIPQGNHGALVVPIKAE